MVSGKGFAQALQNVPTRRMRRRLVRCDLAVLAHFAETASFPCLTTR